MTILNLFSRDLRFMLCDVSAKRCLPLSPLVNKLTKIPLIDYNRSCSGSFPKSRRDEMSITAVVHYHSPCGVKIET
ncbi:MAG: hypothetical protein LBC20_13030 [Planctomycetaceae bacterium]|nr:hypothetical protein [Planctomycetaceae bacterium]